MSALTKISVTLSPQLAEAVENAIRSGEYTTSDEVVIAALAAWSAGRNRGVEDGEGSVFDHSNKEADELAAQRGEADADAGRVVPHEDVARWLDTWGTAAFKPAQKSWVA